MNTSSPTAPKPSSLLKAYGWLSGIIVAFLGSYVTGVLTAVIPPPKEMLCKMSLGFCPAPKVIAFSAVDIDRIIDREGVGQGIGSSQIGMLHNAVEPNVRRPNMVRYRIAVDAAGKYALRILYASSESRPVAIHVNDTEVSNNALEATTGGWDNQNRAWSATYTVSLNAGDNSIMLRRPDVFPHLSKFELTQAR
jgi:hypothetical protein